MKRIVLFLFMLVSVPCFAVGTCVLTPQTSSQNVTNRIPDAETVILTLTCTADAAAGTYPSVLIPIGGSGPSGINAYNLTGYILYAVGRTPGTTAPTANYTTIVTDNRGYALTNALLTANGTASGSQFTWISPTTAPYPVFPVVRTNLTFQLSANSVNSAQIIVDLIFRTRP